MSDQFGRKINLVLSNGSPKGLDLSEMHIVFAVKQSDFQTPNTADIRVFNLSRETATKVRGEFNTVTLQAGYEGDGNYGVIFQGTIKWTRAGKFNGTDSYVDILAADGDIAYNQGVVTGTVAAGASPDDILAAIMKGGEAHGVRLGYHTENGLVGGLLPTSIRGKVFYGMWRDYMSDYAKTKQAAWSIQNGVVQIIDLTSYLPGEAVVLNPQTGLIGIPESTETGVNATCLLNPRIRCGGLVQIDANLINNTVIREQGFPQRNSINSFASVTSPGFYRVLVAECRGDTRGQAWYTDLTCLAVDITAPAEKSVSPQ